MPTIVASTGIVTQINVFTVEAGRQQPLLDLLAEAAESCRGVDGWLSASLHRSLDGTRVANYAQCVDVNAWQLVMDHLRAGAFIDRNRALGTANPGLYEVVRTVER